MLKFVLFICLSAVLAWVSRASLGRPGSHGFYRFFAWECILGLFFLNFISVRQWFGDPFSLRQIASWFLLIVCMVPAANGVFLLHARGEPGGNRTPEEPLVWIEKTTRLVTIGVFRYIRHPLYSSLLLLAWGVFLKRPSWVGIGAALAATGFLVATAKVEEGENARYFGDAYRAYMRNTKMFIPFVF